MGPVEAGMLTGWRRLRSVLFCEHRDEKGRLNMEVENKGKHPL
jgi:hypothetical protein